MRKGRESFSFSMKRKLSWITIRQLSSVRGDSVMARTKKQDVSGDAMFVRRKERRTARGAVTYVPEEIPIPRASLQVADARSPSKSPSKAASHDQYSEPLQEHVVFDNVMPMRSGVLSPSAISSGSMRYGTMAPPCPDALCNHAPRTFPATL